jgi:hypothetical protein
LKSGFFLFTFYFKVLFISKTYMNTPIPNRKKLEKTIRRWVVFFIIALSLSGITAFALETELSWLTGHWPLGRGGALFVWVERTYRALAESNARYPFLAYGDDWLAFGHLVIALFFFGVLRQPVRNIWVIETGMVACILVIPVAFIAGAVRGIPVYWRLIDCSFGILGLVPLGICHGMIQRLAKLR